MSPNLEASASAGTRKQPTRGTSHPPARHTWSGFFGSVAALIVGYIVYAKVVERAFGIEPSRPTPAVSMADGVDYVVLPQWKVFLVQLLNIAGLGPIFGPILGALYGPAALVWIVLGTIFAGAVHDYFSGMLSVRNRGMSVPEVVGRELGVRRCKQFMRGFSILVLLLVGVVFVLGPGEAAHEPLRHGHAVLGRDHLRLLLPRDHPAHRPDHRAALSDLRRGAPVHGDRAHGGALRPGLRGAPERHAREPAPNQAADVAPHVHHHRVRRDQRLPLHAVAAHGTLHLQREAGARGVLRRHGRRGRHRADLGDARDVVLREPRGAQRRHHERRSGCGREPGLDLAARQARRRARNHRRRRPPHHVG